MLMLINKLVIFPLSTPFNWTADYIRQTALILNKRNKIIFYDQAGSQFFLRKGHKRDFPRIKNILFYQPKYYIPFRRFALIENLNRRLSFYLFIHQHRKEDKILWIFDPEYYDFAHLKPKKLISIYDCVDYHSSLDRAKRVLIRKKEKQLIENVNIFTVNSNILYFLNKKNKNKMVNLKAQGFFIPERKVITKMKLAKRGPTVGLVGGINYRLDFKLLLKLIKDNPKWNFVLCGPVQEYPYEDKIFQTAKHLNNIRMFRNVAISIAHNREEVFNIINSFDVAIIPYNTNIDFNRYCYPMKIFEYFYMGKPVVSTPILELTQEAFGNFVKIGKNAAEWQGHIKDLLKEPWPTSYAREQRKMAITNSWEKKVAVISKVILKSSI